MKQTFRKINEKSDIQTSTPKNIKYVTNDRVTLNGTSLSTSMAHGRAHILQRRNISS